MQLPYPDNGTLLCKLQAPSDDNTISVGKNVLLSVNPVSKISLCKCPVKCRGTEGTESCQSTDHNANGLYPKATELNKTSPTHYSSLFKAQQSEAYLRYSFRYNICIWMWTSPFRTCFDIAQLYILEEINCATYKRPKKRLTKKKIH